MDNFREIMDDKGLVIVAVLIICVISMLTQPEANIVDNALTGLFGIAVGKSMNK